MPVLSVKTAIREIDIKESELKLIFKVESGRIPTLSFDNSIRGVIKKMLSRNSITTEKDGMMRSTGRPEGESQNNAELLIENIESNEPLLYNIIYNPLPKMVYFCRNG